MIFTWELKTDDGNHTDSELDSLSAWLFFQEKTYFLTRLYVILIIELLKDMNR